MIGRVAAATCLGLCLLAAPASAQEPTPNPNPMMPGSGPLQRPQGKPFDLTVAVTQVDNAWKRAPAPGAEVLLEVYAGDTRVKSYTAKTDASGAATFQGLFRIEGARYVPVATFEGVVYRGAPLSPTQDAHTSQIDVYGKTYEDSALQVSDLMTTVDVVERFLVFMQMWSFVNTAPQTFDVAHATDPRYAEGLVIELPIKAEGIQARIFLPTGEPIEAQVVESRIYIKEPIPPAGEGSQPLRVQIHYSMKLEDTDFAYAQPIAYPVESMRVIVNQTTPYKRHPRLNLTLEAPGFGSVGRNQQMPGMREGMEFVVARDGQAKPGDTLRFTIRGYPVPKPWGAWLALGGGALVLAAGGFILQRERSRQSDASRLAALRLKALQEERESLYDALRYLDDRYYNGEVSDRAYDLEVASLRERLALVLRRLEAEGKEQAA